MTKPLFTRIGTRKSPLALAQTELVKQHILQHHPKATIEIIPIETTGDRFLSQNLYEVGGKGLFTKEIEHALLNQDIDLAVHSLKDVPAECPEGLHLCVILARHFPSDLYISYRYPTLDSLPKGATIGTSSPRRAAQIRHLRSDLTIIPFRGNVQTRLKKLADNVADATFLAEAGLERLALETPNLHRQRMPYDQMLPAVGQGTLALQTRTDDATLNEALAPLSDLETHQCTLAERAFLAAFDGSCRTPIAALATQTNQTLTLQGQILSFDGTRIRKTSLTAPVSEASTLGENAAQQLLEHLETDFFGTQE